MRKGARAGSTRRPEEGIGSGRAPTAAGDLHRRRPARRASGKRWSVASLGSLASLSLTHLMIRRGGRTPSFSVPSIEDVLEGQRRGDSYDHVECDEDAEPPSGCYLFESASEKEIRGQLHGGEEDRHERGEGKDRQHELAAARVRGDGREQGSDRDEADVDEPGDQQEHEPPGPQLQREEEGEDGQDEGFHRDDVAEVRAGLAEEEAGAVDGEEQQGLDGTRLALDLEGAR